VHYETSCGDLIKILFWDRQGMCLYAKKLDRGRFIWPQAKDGIVSLTMAQLSMLLESSTGAPQLCESDRFSGWRKRCRLKSRSWPLRRELAQREAIIAVRDAELAEAAVVKARLTPALLEIEQIKLQLATLRWQRYGQSSERLDSDIAQLEMRLKDCEERLGEQIAARSLGANHCGRICRARWWCRSLRSSAAATIAIPHVWPSWERSSRRCWRRSLPGSR
jgi:hypothetical protein